MKLFFTTDIHGSERCYRKFLNAAKAYGADALVLGGDITGKIVVPLVEEPDGRVTADVFGLTREARTPAEREELENNIRQSGSYTVSLTRSQKEAIDGSSADVDALFRKAIIDTTSRWMELAKERLEPLGIPIYVSAGNDDEPYVEQILENADYVCWPEDRIVELPDGREMVSIGYSNVTPFDSPRELPDDELERRMERVAAGLKDPERAVFNFHCPPHSTNLDAAPKLDANLKPVYEGGTMMVAPAGSRATRALIERYQPVLSLHGHIHESRASQKIGRTLTVNPGSEYSEGVLRGCLIELKDKKIRGWQFKVGDVVVTIGGTSTLGWDEYEAVVYGHAPVEISDTARIDQHRDELGRQVAAGATIYSVNTGYGAEADRRLPPESIDIVQANTLRSHAMGTGPDAPEHIVRGQMLLKAQAYAQGPAALRLTLVERIVWCLNNGVCPAVPVYGSQSASGDLVPNAHLGLAFMGEGFVVESGARRPAHEVMPNAFVPAMKEGVALTNDCSFATAFAYGAVRDGTRLIDRTEEVAAMTLQALRGHPEAFDDRLVALRPHPGARRSAAAIRALIDQSELLSAPGRPHDPYSLRCIPQVHGAIRDAVAYARSAVEIELGSIGDNPVVLLDDRTTLSGGNIHGEPIAIPMDIVTIAMAELAVLSQRRTAHLVNSRFDIGLPPKLSPDASHGFGLLMLNTTAAALVSEIRTLTAPAAVESIEVDHMEDHVSMAAVAARKATTVISLVRRVVAAELVCAAQALDFHGAERASKPTRDLHSAVRERIPFVSSDRPLDVEQVVDLL